MLLPSGYIGLKSSAWASGTPTGNYAPSTGSVSPSTGTSCVNQAKTFTMTYSDPNDWRDLRWASAWLISSNGRPAVRMMYNRSTNRMHVLSQDGSKWLGGYAPGSSHTVAAGHATVKMADSTISDSGNTLTVRWTVVFQEPTRGGKYGVTLRASDLDGIVVQRSGIATQYVLARKHLRRLLSVGPGRRRYRSPLKRHPITQGKGPRVGGCCGTIHPVETCTVRSYNPALALEGAQRRAAKAQPCSSTLHGAHHPV